MLCSSLSLRCLRPLRHSPYALPFARTYSHGTSLFPQPKEYKVVLDNQTLYVEQELAEALGWKAAGDSVKLSLNGWSLTYFTITPSGTDSEHLARATVESSQNPNVQEVLRRLK